MVLEVRLIIEPEAAILGWLQIAEPDGYQFGHPGLFHGHAEEGIGDAHRSLIVRDDEELSVLRQLL